MRTLEITANVESEINKLVQHSVNMEYQVAALKKVIRVLASSVKTNDNGSREMVLTENEAAFVTKVCDELHVFT